jgi:hypothetical protein
MFSERVTENQCVMEGAGGTVVEIGSGAPEFD